MRFVETNIFLYVITAHPEFGAIARSILSRIDSGEEAATSSLVIAEVCAWLEYRKKKTVSDYSSRVAVFCHGFGARALFLTYFY